MRLPALLRQLLAALIPRSRCSIQLRLRQWLIIIWHLPLPFPPGSIRGQALLRLQDLDRDSIPTDKVRWQGREARQVFMWRMMDPRRLSTLSTQVFVIGADGC